MTFVFAARCKDGVLVAGDRRVVAGEDRITDDEQTKVEAIDKHSVVGFAGNRYSGQHFFDGMKEAAEKKPKNLLELVAEAEDILNKLWDDYSKPTEDSEVDDARKKDNANLETFIVGLDQTENGKARIYRAETKLVPDVSDDIEFLGQGGQTGDGALAVLWNKELTTDEAWPLAAVTMKLIGSRQYSVGGIPDIYLVKDNAGASKVPSAKVKQVYESIQVSEALKGIPGYVLHTLNSSRTERKQVKQ